MARFWAARTAGDSGAENDSYNKATGRIFLNELAGYRRAKDL
jgi:hypothetical protein